MVDLGSWILALGCGILDLGYQIRKTWIPDPDVHEEEEDVVQEKVVQVEEEEEEEGGGGACISLWLKHSLTRRPPSL